jgi:TonB family protein
MSISARTIAIAMLSVCAAAQPVPTPEEEVIAMLREWRALRAAKGPDPVPEAPVPVEAPGAIIRVRVGGNVQQSALISGSQPDYPEEARAQGVEGVVTLEALIGVDGMVQSLSVISGDPALVPAALESVKGWTYRPTLLNGVPIEVLTLVEVNFTLQGIPVRAPRKKR